MADVTTPPVVVTPDPWLLYDKTAIGKFEKMYYPGFAKKITEKRSIEFVHFKFSGSVEQSIYALRSPADSWDTEQMALELPSLASESGKRFLPYMIDSRKLSIVPVGGRKLVTNSAVAWNINSSVSKLDSDGLRVAVQDIAGGFTNLWSTLTKGMTNHKSLQIDGHLSAALVNVTEDARAMADAMVRAAGFIPSSGHKIIVCSCNFNTNGKELEFSRRELTMQAGAKYLVFGGYQDPLPVEVTGWPVQPYNFGTAIMIPYENDNSTVFYGVARSMQDQVSGVRPILDPRFAKEPANQTASISWPGLDFYTDGVDPKSYTPTLLGEIPGLPAFPKTARIVSGEASGGEPNNENFWFVKPKLSLLPLIGPPGAVEYFLDAEWPDQVSTETLYTGLTLVEDPDKDTPVEVTVKMTTVELTCARELYAVSFAWFAKYIETGYGIYKPLTGDALVKAKEAIAEYQGLTATGTYYRDGFAIPKDVVTRLSMYRAYKKARDKACLSNDFMEKEFANGIKWGAVDKHFADLSYDLHWFYGLRDVTSTTAIIGPSSKDYIGTTIRYNAAVGTNPPYITVEGDVPVDAKDAGAVFEALAGGAKLVGATNAEVASFFGADGTGMVEGAQDAASSLGQYDQYSNTFYRGRGRAQYDFALESIGVTGFVIYPEMAVQDAYKAVIASEMLQKSAASLMVQAAQQFSTDAVIRALWDK